MGVISHLGTQAHTVQKGFALLADVGKDLCFICFKLWFLLFDQFLCQRYVLQSCVLREQIKVLENHAKMQAVLTNLRLRHPSRCLRIKHRFIVYQDLAAGGCLQKIQAAKKGRFTASRRTDHGQSFSFFQSKADILENLRVPKCFADMLHL